MRNDLDDPALASGLTMALLNRFPPIITSAVAASVVKPGKANFKCAGNFGQAGQLFT